MEAESHAARGDTEEAVWLEFNNALVCHTWTGFVGQISMEGLREREREREGGRTERDRDVQAKQIGCSSLLRPPYTWE